MYILLLLRITITYTIHARLHTELYYHKSVLFFLCPLVYVY